MRDLECQFEWMPTPESTSVVSPQVVQVWNGDVLVVTAIVMVNSAVIPEFVSCKIDHQIHIVYRETSPEAYTFSMSAIKLVFEIKGIKKVRDYAIELSKIG